MDAAIVSPSKILPLSKISEKHKRICIDLINDNRKYVDNICTYDPLTELTSAFSDLEKSSNLNNTKSIESLDLESRLKTHIIEGERNKLDETLKEAFSRSKSKRFFIFRC